MKNRNSLGFESLKLEGNLDYTLYIGESLPTDIKIPMYLYTLERDGDVQIVNYFSFSYKTNISDNIESSVSVFHTVFEEDQVFQPQFLIDILTSYSNNKYSLSLGANMELENYGLNFKNHVGVKNKNHNGGCAVLNGLRKKIESCQKLLNPL